MCVHKAHHVLHVSANTARRISVTFRDKTVNQIPEDGTPERPPCPSSASRRAMSARERALAACRCASSLCRSAVRIASLSRRERSACREGDREGVRGNLFE